MLSDSHVRFIYHLSPPGVHSSLQPNHGNLQLQRVSIHQTGIRVHGYHICIIFRCVVKRLGTEKLRRVTTSAQMLCLKPIDSGPPHAELREPMPNYETVVALNALSIYCSILGNDVIYICVYLTTIPRGKLSPSSRVIISEICALLGV
jgi:hypothetical protein